MIRIYGKPDCIVSEPPCCAVAIVSRTNGATMATPSANGGGTEFTSTAILKGAGDTGVAWHYIDPGKPQHRAMVCHWFEDNGEGVDRKLQRQSEG